MPLKILIQYLHNLSVLKVDAPRAPSAVTRSAVTSWTHVSGQSARLNAKVRITYYNCIFYLFYENAYFTCI